AQGDRAVHVVAHAVVPQRRRCRVGEIAVDGVGQGVPGADGELPWERRADRRTVPHLVATVAGRKDLDAALYLSAGGRRAAAAVAGRAEEPDARTQVVRDRARQRRGGGDDGDNRYASRRPVGAPERPSGQRPAATA